MDIHRQINAHLGPIEVQWHRVFHSINPRMSCTAESGVVGHNITEDIRVVGNIQPVQSLLHKLQEARDCTVWWVGFLR
jgi:hypothetical protein